MRQSCGVYANINVFKLKEYEFELKKCQSHLQSKTDVTIQIYVRLVRPTKMTCVTLHCFDSEQTYIFILVY